MNRRDFVTRFGMAAAALGAGVSVGPGQVGGGEKGAPFKLKYGPHFGMFVPKIGSKDPVDELKYAHDQGFRAWEDNGMKKRPVEEQERIAKAMADLGIQMGVFVVTGNASATEPTFAVKKDDVWNQVLAEIREGVDVAKRCNVKWMTVVLGAFDLKLAWDYQTANAVELLKRCCDILEPHGLVMVLEPLNRHTNHPTMFLAESPHAYQICRAVGSPSCKILFDIYHQQITEGNLIPNIDLCWDEIGYFQAGDNPGRKEPGTGEINYRRVFQHMHKKGFRGVVGMEHGVSMKGPEGVDALIKAYREADAFEV